MLANHCRCGSFACRLSTRILLKRQYFRARSTVPLISGCLQKLKENTCSSRLVYSRVALAELGTVTTTVIGSWASFSNSIPASYIQRTLIEIHDLSGLPWWSTIVLSTVLLRTIITLPLTVYQNKILARIELISLEMAGIVAELKKEAVAAKNKFNWSKEQTLLVLMRSTRKQWTKLIIRENCHPAKSAIVLLAQMPLWICQSVALRNLATLHPDPNDLQANIAYADLNLGGFGWITDLAEVDNCYILPITLFVTNMLVVEMHSMLRQNPSTKIQNLTTNALRGINVVMIPISASIPSVLCLYWVTSSAYSLTQNLLLLSPRVRRLVGIPKVNSEVREPYKHLWQQLNARARQIKFI